MTTKKDIDILIECVEEAKRTRDSIAVKIAERAIAGKMPTAKLVREYKVAQMGVDSTVRDLETCVETAAHIESLEVQNAKID